MLPDHRPFLDLMFALLPGRAQDYAPLVIDHLCYRVATLAEYHAMRDGLRETNVLLTESVIGGRPISVFRMATPFAYGERLISLLELPAPKAGRPYPAGWEHAEFVTPGPLVAFAGWLTDKQGVPADAVDRSGVHKASNADLRLRLGQGLSVKFHEKPLDEVIRREQAEGAAAGAGKVEEEQ